MVEDSSYLLFGLRPFAFQDVWNEILRCILRRLPVATSSSILIILRNVS
jgi:hypothetical protein